MFRLPKWIGFVLMASSALALPTDETQKLNIVADSTVINYKTGANVYEGQVKIDQGSTHVTADKVTTQNNAQHKLEEAIAYGTNKPARYWTIPKEGDVEFNAFAKIIHYYPIKATVVLEGDVVVTQGNNSFHGPYIIYNIKDQIVSAPASQKGRATIIIEPKNIS